MQKCDLQVGKLLPCPVPLLNSHSSRLLCLRLNTVHGLWDYKIATFYSHSLQPFAFGDLKADNLGRISYINLRGPAQN